MRAAPRPPPPSTSCRQRHALKHSDTFQRRREASPMRGRCTPHSLLVISSPHRRAVGTSIHQVSCTPSLLGATNGMGCPCGAYQSVTVLGGQGGRFVGGGRGGAEWDAETRRRVP
jgi:hypothetical protein